MSERKRIGIALFLLAFVAVPAAAAEQWLHVRVEQRTGGGETIHLNLPLDFVEAMLPRIAVDELEHGRVSIDEIDLDELGLDGLDLRELVVAFRDAPDSDFVKIQREDGRLRVAKEGDYLVVLGEEGEGTGRETLSVRLPLVVLEALVGSGGDTLDLAAGLSALRGFEGEDLVVIDGEDESVRIWIDAKENGS